jgi:hypothetical protein
LKTLVPSQEWPNWRAVASAGGDSLAHADDGEIAMSGSDPASTRGPQQPAQETQQLIAQLTSLMPVLLRLQGQFTQPSAPQFAPVGFMIQNQMLDYQAAVNLVEDITASSLRTLSSYLEANLERNTGLQGCVAIVTQAAQCFAARDFAQAFDLIWQAYRQITMLRVADPQLPPVRATEAAGAFPPSPVSMH